MTDIAALKSRLWQTLENTRQYEGVSAVQERIEDLQKACDELELAVEINATVAHITRLTGLLEDNKRKLESLYELQGDDDA